MENDDVDLCRCCLLAEHSDGRNPDELGLAALDATECHDADSIVSVHFAIRTAVPPQRRGGGGGGGGCCRQMVFGGLEGGGVSETARACGV